MQNYRRLLGGGVVAALLLFIGGLPLYAASTFSADYGRHVDFKPLVRHMISQVHCYDLGTDKCEKTSHFGTKFTKEHTLGFLLDGPRRTLTDRGFKPLYLCEAKNHSGVMMVTAGTTESDPRAACRDAGFRADQVGYISSTNQMEAPWPLYRCVNSSSHDTLLTDSANECSLAGGYSSAQLLGYLYAGGPLPVLH